MAPSCAGSRTHSHSVSKGHQSRSKSHSTRTGLQLLGHVPRGVCVCVCWGGGVLPREVFCLSCHSRSLSGGEVGGTGSSHVDEVHQDEQSLLDLVSVVATLRSLYGHRWLLQRAVRSGALGWLWRMMGSLPPRIVSQLVDRRLISLRILIIGFCPLLHACAWRWYRSSCSTQEFVAAASTCFNGRKWLRPVPWIGTWHCSQIYGPLTSRAGPISYSPRLRLRTWRRPCV